MKFQLTALRFALIATWIVIAAGEAGRAHVGCQNEAAMANKLGTTVVDFLGHYVSYVGHPRAFAARLQEVPGEIPLT